MASTLVNAQPMQKPMNMLKWACARAACLRRMTMSSMPMSLDVVEHHRQLLLRDLHLVRGFSDLKLVVVLRGMLSRFEGMQLDPRLQQPVDGEHGLLGKRQLRLRVSTYRD